MSVCTVHGSRSAMGLKLTSSPLMWLVYGFKTTWWGPGFAKIERHFFAVSYPTAF